MQKQKKFRVPWDEKTTPGHIPERVKLEVPWDESVEQIILTPPVAKGRQRQKPGRGRRKP
jgi:hypothetical protein